MFQRTHIKSLRCAAVFALAASALAAEAQARVGTICLDLPSGAGTVKASISSGCLPTSPQHKGAFDIAVDGDTATISIEGGFSPVREQRIGTADCMGSQTIEQDARAAGPRRYSVVVNGQYRGVLDASDTMFGRRAVSACFAGRSEVALARPEKVTTYVRSQFRGWIPRPKGKPAQPLYAARYATLGDAAAALLGNHPESFEGRPSAEVTISPARWRRMGLEKPPGRVNAFMAIQIEEHGFADDSVSGKRTFASAVPDEKRGGWRIDWHWHQFMCARGERSGQWTNEPCP